MTLEDDDRSAAEQWLREKMKNRSCTICQASDWVVGEMMVYPSDDITDEIMRNNPALLEVVCRNCAHVLFFDVRYMPDGLANKAAHVAVM